MDLGQNHIHNQPAANLYYQLSSDSPFPGMGAQQQFPPFTSLFGASPSTNIPHMDWNPATMLDNLTFIEEKIQQVKDVIRTMVDDGGQGGLAQKQQVVNADLTCLIVQLISTAGSLLPSLKNSSFLSHPAAGHVDHVGPSWSVLPNAMTRAVSEENREDMCSPEDYEELFKGWTTDGAMEDGGVEIDGVLVEEQDTKDGGDEGKDGDNNLPPPGSYELLQLEEDEILAPHTHFCTICGKGFKRDANLRMHMRGHGDEYKSPAALAKPPRDASAEHDQPAKRYSCPFVGCKRNKLHKNFQHLKTILCVKNHYKRSHCEKSHTCSRCHAKKFSIMADLKTHEKHCGRDKWLCSCGTSFSRKDKLFAHVALFQGHTPALSSPEEPPKACSDQIGRAGSRQEPARVPAGAVGSSSFVWGASSGENSALDTKGFDGCSDDFLSTANFGSFNLSFGPADGFTGEPSGGGSFSMLPPEHFQSAQKEGQN